MKILVEIVSESTIPQQIGLVAESSLDGENWVSIGRADVVVTGRAMTWLPAPFAQLPGETRRVRATRCTIGPPPTISIRLPKKED